MYLCLLSYRDKEDELVTAINLEFRTKNSSGKPRPQFMLIFLFLYHKHLTLFFEDNFHFTLPLK